VRSPFQRSTLRSACESRRIVLKRQSRLITGGARRHPQISIEARAIAAERLHGVRTTTEIRKIAYTQNVGEINAGSITNLSTESDQAYQANRPVISRAAPRVTVGMVDWA
jgi:hypothetical protein